VIVIGSIILFVLVQLADVWSTNRVLKLGGVEANPPVRFAMRHLGRLWPLWKVFLLVPGFALAWGHPYFLGVLWLSTAAMAVVVALNCRLIRKLENA